PMLWQRLQHADHRFLGDIVRVRIRCAEDPPDGAEDVGRDRSDERTNRFRLASPGRASEIPEGVGAVARGATPHETYDSAALESHRLRPVTEDGRNGSPNFIPHVDAHLALVPTSPAGREREALRSCWIMGDRACRARVTRPRVSRAARPRACVRERRTDG